MFDRERPLLAQRLVDGGHQRSGLVQRLLILQFRDGVVDDAAADTEYQETLDKARALVTAVDEALGEQGSFAVERAEPTEGVR